jgi:FAD/FMN-containing dehydrogenase/Fe-S oxidoreductase
MGGKSDSNEIVEALRRRGVAEVDSSTLTRAMYSSDASLYRVVPQVVVRPRHVDEALAVIDACRETQTPLTSRGAGTSIAGNAVGTGVVMDFRQHLNRVLDIDPEARRATVEPGIVQAALQQAARPHGLRFGPDPSTNTRCTIGGMIGNNACGSRALGYGTTSENVRALDVATIDGGRLHLGGGATSPLLGQLDSLVSENLAVVRTEFGRFSRQVSGYGLEHLLPEKGADVAAFLVGTEGTLAVTLGATVNLVPVPKNRHLVVLGYPSMDRAADAVPSLLEIDLTACEGLGRRIVEVFAAAHGPASVPELPDGDGLLFVELAGDEPADLAARAEQVVVLAAALGARHVTDTAEQAVLWRIREEGAGLAARSFDRPAYAGWEDAAVPPERLGDYLRDFADLLKQHDLRGVPFGHFGDGCVHVRIDFPFGDTGGSAAFRAFLVDAAHLAAGFGGSFSGEHGDGRARSELLPIMYSSDAMDLMSRVKRLFDPTGLLNPGVLVDPAPLDAGLRPAVRSKVAVSGLRLAHDDGDFGAAVHRCTGVGKCVAATSSGVMCPSFQATGEEKDSTRGRARVLQEMIDGRLVTGGFGAEEVHEALDLCLACKGCLSDCPTGTDMASYKSTVLHETYRGRLRPRSHYILGRLPWHAARVAPFAAVANALLRIAPLAAIAKWVAGVDQRRSLPPFATRTFTRSSRAKPAPSGRHGRLVIWADSFTEHFVPAGGLAAIDVLTAAGYSVEVLRQRACCGLTWITTGQLDKARSMMAHTIDVLHPIVAAGVPVVGLEPSCLAALRSDALELLDDPRAAEVAASLSTLAEVLLRTPDWHPPARPGVEVVVQPHCHQSAVLGFDADRGILERTGATVRQVAGCCGLAGNFGVEKGHYDVSVAVAEQNLLPAVREAPSGAVVIADGYSCRVQLDDLADIPAVTLAQFLAEESPR